jgi:hemerythrin
MKQRRGQAEIESILNFLEGYIKVHFNEEEGCMEKYRCPLAEPNLRAHAKFTQTFNKLRAQFRVEGASAALAIAMQRDLLDWFVNHIRKVDTSLHGCVKDEKSQRAIATVGSNGRNYKEQSSLK